MNKYYIISLVFWIVYLVLDIIEYIVLKHVKKIEFKNFFDYKFNSKKRIEEKRIQMEREKMHILERDDNSNAGDDDNF